MSIDYDRSPRKRRSATQEPITQPLPAVSRRQMDDVLRENFQVQIGFLSEQVHDLNQTVRGTPGHMGLTENMVRVATMVEAMQDKINSYEPMLTAINNYILAERAAKQQPAQAEPKAAEPKAAEPTENNVTFKWLVDKFGAPVISAVLVALVFEIWPKLWLLLQQYPNP